MKISPQITPHLWFDKDAIAAAKFYCSIFPNSKMISKGKITDTPSGDCETVSFQLGKQKFMAISAGPYFKFNESISFMVVCKDQKEIDYYWKKLTADGGQESMCGWLKDKYGLSWQIVPSMMNKMMGSKDKAAVKRVTGAFLKMKKFDIKKLEEAFNGK